MPLFQVRLLSFVSPMNQNQKDSSTSKDRLFDVPQDHFFETSTDEEWLAEFHKWVDSHKGKDIPVLSDDAMSRESIYPDRW